VSGLILLLERPIKIGDTIEVGALMGVVKSIGIRASNVHTLDGAEIIVPNGNLISNEVINWTLSDKRRRIEVLVGVAYGSDPYQVQKIFLDILSSQKDIVKDPKPIVLFNNFGDSSLDFRILFWTDNFDEWIRIRSEVIFRIHDGLKEAGIQIPFPQRDLNIRSVDSNLEVKKVDK
jgi:small-conductance mechanosensitive channel